MNQKYYNYFIKQVNSTENVDRKSIITIEHLRYDR